MNRPRLIRRTPVLVIPALLLLPGGGEAFTGKGTDAQAAAALRWSAVVGPVEADSSEARSRPTWNLIDDTGHAVVSTVKDLGYVYSSPARITLESALILGGVVLVGGLVYAFDQEIYDALKRNEFESPYESIRDAGEFFEPLGYQGDINKYIIGALVVGYAIRNEAVVTVSGDIIEALLVASPGKRLGNTVVGRRGPLLGMGARSFEWGDGRSFPSGHSVTIMALTGVLTHHVDVTAFDIFAYAVAGTVLLQRITSDHHWPSDVFAGGLWGWFVAKEILSRRVGDGVRVGALRMPAGPGLGVSCRF